MKSFVNRIGSKALMAVIVAALGYFVDVYDIVLFGIVRVASLKSLGISGDELLTVGTFLINSQMTGMLIGGLLWGIIGDKFGRIQVLFGSIILYSVANILNAYVTSIDQYALCRLFAGLGLAGEIGAGITLVSELLPKEVRGIGTTIVATVGVFGGVVAALVGDLFQWQTAYIVGGVMGFALLILRFSVVESGLFEKIKSHSDVKKGDLLLLIKSPKRFGRYLACILVGIPLWYINGIIITFSPEIAKGLGIVEPVKTATSVLCFSIALTIGDLVSGLLSQYFKTRKKIIFTFTLAAFICVFTLLSTRGISANLFYAACIPMGFFVGIWAVFLSTSAEQFGTNLRATVTTSIPNFVRGSIIIMTSMLTMLKANGFDIITGAEIVGALFGTLSLCSLFFLRETFGVDLNFVEEKTLDKKNFDLIPKTNEAEVRQVEGWR